MSFASAELDQFIAWARKFDPCTLQREADVEEDFVKPLFRLLGYSDTYLREKYPLKGYNPGKSGRKPETDIIYFSTEKKDDQDSNTSLLLIEAKEPNETDLEKDIEQATFYSEHLKPMFYSVTNSHRLMIFQRYRYHNDECIFDNPVSDLQKIEIATRLFRSLHFNVVKTLKEQAVNELTHELYTELNLALNHKPDLLTQIAKGDFISSKVLEGRRLVVSRPKVAIDCKLPLVFKGGSCRIEFSNIMLRGLTCELMHEDIVRDLLIGLQTPPLWHNRCFFQKTSSNGNFEAHLGQTIVLLSEQEAKELCECIDIVGNAYKEALIEATNLLEAWNFLSTKNEDYQGFTLLSVKPWLWKLMKRFMLGFDILEGKSAWHIFDVRLGIIHIHGDGVRGDINMSLWAIPEGNRVPNEWVDVLYLDPDEGVLLFKGQWKQFVGPHGIWTVRYANEWILKEFIPKVLSYYRVQLQCHQHPFIHIQEWLTDKVAPNIFSVYKEYLQKKKEEQRQVIINDAILDGLWNTGISLSEITNLKHLAPYLHAVQSWLASYGTYTVAATTLREYYVTFTEIAKYIDPSSVNIGYIQAKLGWAERCVHEFLDNEVSEEEEEKMYKQLSNYDGILYYLNRHVERIQQIEHEDRGVAELISRVYCAIVEDGSGYIQQKLLNQAIEIMQLLWKQSQFESRYVRPLLKPFSFD